jgi:hypothetical protein
MPRRNHRWDGQPGSMKCALCGCQAIAGPSQRRKSEAVSVWYFDGVKIHPKAPNCKEERQNEAG